MLLGDVLVAYSDDPQAQRREVLRADGVVLHLLRFVVDAPIDLDCQTQ
jgi:hypothetical protein